MRLTLPILSAAVLIFALLPAHSRPLLPSSEVTFSKACRDRDTDPERLIQLCEAALEEGTGSLSQRLDAMDALAWAYSNIGKDAQAQQLFGEMLALDPRSVDAMNGLGWIAWDADVFDDAVVHFEKALKVTYSAESLAGAASSRYGADLADLEETLVALEAAHAIDPDYNWPLREMGWILQRADQHSRAEAAFRRNLEIDAEDINGLLGLSRALRDQDQYEDALEVINRALELRPGALVHLYERGLNLYYLDRDRVALGVAKQIVESYPEEDEGYVLMARVLHARGQGDAAVNVLQNYIGDIGRSRWANYWLVEVLQWNDRHAEALAVLEQIETDYDPASYHYDDMYESAIELKDLARARIAVDAMLAQDSSDAEVVYYDAVLLAHDRQFDRAETRAQEAVSLGYAKDDMDDFFGVLAESGEFVRMIQFRVRLNDAAKASQD